MFLLLSMASVMASTLAQAEPQPRSIPCSGWLEGQRLRGAVLSNMSCPQSISEVNDSLVWDPDGAGPQRARLVVAGSFTSIDHAGSSGAAMFDGVSWHPLGGPSELQSIDPRTHISDPAIIEALAVHEDMLIASGRITHVNGEPSGGLIRWDHDRWRAMGDSPLTGASALISFNGELIGAGTFAFLRTPQQGSFESVAIFRDGAWSPFQEGILGGSSTVGPSSNVHALVVHEGSLIAAGQFTYSHALRAIGNPTRWSGVRWERVGSPGVSDGPVFALVSHNARLYAGGAFTQIAGVPAVGVAEWDGVSWRGMDLLPPDDAQTTEVESLAVFDEVLFVGGAFRRGVNGPASPMLMRRAEQGWQSAHSGFFDLGLSQTNCSSRRGVRSLTPYFGSLILGGFFDGEQDNAAAPAGLAQWNGVLTPAPGRTPGIPWSECGGASMVGSLNSRIVLAGPVHVGGQPDVIVSQLFLQESDGWSLIGEAGPTNSEECRPAFRCSVESAGELVVGGAFEAVNGQPAINIARFDGAEWRPLGPGIDGEVLALLDCDLGLIVGGSFETAGERVVNNIARWDGAEWHALGNGLSKSGYPEFASVKCLAWFGGSIIAGGSWFSIQGDGSDHGIARWSGTVWRPLVEDAHGIRPRDLRGLAVVNDLLYGVGEFIQSSSRFGSSSLGEWNGESWTLIQRPAEYGLFVPFSQIAGYHGSLYAVASVGAQPEGAFRRHLVHWDGQQWYVSPEYFNRFPVVPADATQNNWPLPAGMAVVNDELIVCGSMLSVGETPSVHFARWSDRAAPWIRRNPMDLCVAPREDASFAVEPGLDPDALIYQWRRAGLPLTDGPTLAGTMISGSSTHRLRLEGVQPEDAGEYSCDISNPCGSTTSEPALLAVVPALCFGDADGDRTVNFSDVTAVLEHWGATAIDGFSPGDSDHDGRVGFSDIGTVIANWRMTCP